MKRKYFPTILVFLIVLLTCGAVVSSSAAQTRRKKAAVSATPKPLATPLPGDAQIVSRASDEPEDATIVVPQPVRSPTPATESNSQKIRDLNVRIKKLETAQANEYDEKQKRLLLNLDILTRAEQRSEAIRKQLFEMIEKETSVKIRLDQIDFESRPETIARSANTLSGSMKPEELREMRQKALDSERKNLAALMTEIQTTRDRLQANLLRSDELVERLRTKLEKEIDAALTEDEPEN